MLRLHIDNHKFEFDEFGDGTYVSLINTEINEIEMEIDMECISKAGFLYCLLSISFPKSLRRLVFRFFVFYLFKFI